MSEAIDLFRIVNGNTVWRFTSSTRAYTHDSETYLPIAIGRGSLDLTDEVAKTSLTVSVPQAIELAQALIQTVSNISTTITLFRAIAGSVSAWYKGRLSGIEPNGTVLKMTFVSVFTAMKRTGIRRTASRLCPYSIYGALCGVSVDSFYEQVEVVSISGNQLIVNYAGTNNFKGGIAARWNTDYKSMVVSHVGSTITLSRPLPGLTTSVLLAVGCNKNFHTCKDVFNNIENYGGFAFMTVNNPYSGSDAI